MKKEIKQPENNRLLLEAQMGRLFLQLEESKAFQLQVTQRINQIIEELKKVEQNG